MSGKEGTYIGVLYINRMESDSALSLSSCCLLLGSLLRLLLLGCDSQLGMLQIEAVDRTRRALLQAHTAVLALRVIDRSDVVLDRDSLELADLHALAAADTTVVALLARCGTLIGVAAENVNLSLLRNHVDEVLRARLRALTASDAGVMVDLRYAVDDADRVKVADIDTIAKADAAEGTSGIAAEEGLRTGAGLHTLPLENLLRSVARAVALDLCDLFLC